MQQPRNSRREMEKDERETKSIDRRTEGRENTGEIPGAAEAADPRL